MLVNVIPFDVQFVGYATDENVGGIAVGSFGVGTLLYVDDMILLCTNDVEATAAHLKAVGFSVRKRLKFSHKKCFLLVAFKKKQDEVPKLEIDGSPVAVTNVVKVLGDLFNDKGNNKDLINDRIQRGNSCTVNSISLCNVFPDAMQVPMQCNSR